MRIINIVSQLLFFTGLLLKFFHIHFNAILMLMGLLGILITILVGLLKNKSKFTLLLTLSNFGWLLLIFVSIKFLPIQTAILIITVLLTLLTTILTIRSKKTKTLWPIVISSAMALSFFFLPTHKRFKLLSINWNYEIETDYITLDKYSWFLYQNGEFLDALEVSKKARNIANQLGDNEWVDFIDIHSKAIEDRKWGKYP